HRYLSARWRRRGLRRRRLAAARLEQPDRDTSRGGAYPRGTPARALVSGGSPARGVARCGSRAGRGFRRARAVALIRGEPRELITQLGQRGREICEPLALLVDDGGWRLGNEGFVAKLALGL